MAKESFDDVKKYRDLLPKAFGSLGFQLKPIFIGGSGVKLQEPVERSSLFGHWYDGNTDVIEHKFYVNFSAKKRSSHSEPNLSYESFNLKNIKLNKRKMLSLLSSQFDPIGLVSCFLSKYKIFIAHLFRKNYDWDTELDEVDQKQATYLTREILLAAEKGVKFNRSIKPPGFVLHSIICMVDASSVALQVVLFGCFSKGSEKHTSLLCAKTKVCSDTIPKCEFMAILAGHRLVKTYLQATDEKPQFIEFISDSTCTLDILKSTFSSKELWFQNRIAEMRKICHEINIAVSYTHLTLPTILLV